MNAYVKPDPCQDCGHEDLCHWYDGGGSCMMEPPCDTRPVCDSKFAVNPKSIAERLHPWEFDNFPLKGTDLGKKYARLLDYLRTDLKNEVAVESRGLIEELVHKIAESEKAKTGEP